MQTFKSTRKSALIIPINPIKWTPRPSRGFQYRKKSQFIRTGTKASDLTRTGDLLITSETHYRLCYTSICNLFSILFFRQLVNSFLDRSKIIFVLLVKIEKALNLVVMLSNLKRLAFLISLFRVLSCLFSLVTAVQYC